MTDVPIIIHAVCEHCHEVNDAYTDKDGNPVCAHCGEQLRVCGNCARFTEQYHTGYCETCLGYDTVRNRDSSCSKHHEVYSKKILKGYCRKVQRWVTANILDCRGGVHWLSKKEFRVQIRSIPTIEDPTVVRTIEEYVKTPAGEDEEEMKLLLAKGYVKCEFCEGLYKGEKGLAQHQKKCPVKLKLERNKEGSNDG